MINPPQYYHQWVAKFILPNGSKWFRLIHRQHGAKIELTERFKRGTSLSNGWMKLDLGLLWVTLVNLEISKSDHSLRFLQLRRKPSMGTHMKRLVLNGFEWIHFFTGFYGRTSCSDAVLSDETYTKRRFQRKNPPNQYQINQ